MNYNKIIKAINEGLDKALMSFDDELIFDKKREKRNKTAEYIVYLEEAELRLHMLTQERYQWFLDQYLTNGFQYTVNDKNKLKNIIIISSKVAGPQCNLNWIDTSKITDMSLLFNDLNFNGDISKWDVSNVINMHGIFYNSRFNGDISNWNVSNVQDMRSAFSGSIFNGNISNWDVSNVEDMLGMFFNSPFNGDISKWDVSNVEEKEFMFKNSPLENDPPVWYKK